MKSYKLAILTVAAGFLWSLNATAQTFNYNNGDLLLGFRTPERNVRFDRGYRHCVPV